MATNYLLKLDYIKQQQNHQKNRKSDQHYGHGKFKTNSSPGVSPMLIRARGVPGSRRVPGSLAALICVDAIASKKNLLQIHNQWSCEKRVCFKQDFSNCFVKVVAFLLMLSHQRIFMRQGSQEPFGIQAPHGLELASAIPPGLNWF